MAWVRYVTCCGCCQSKRASLSHLTGFWMLLRQADHDVAADQEEAAVLIALRTAGGERAGVAPELARHAHADREQQWLVAGPIRVTEQVDPFDPHLDFRDRH